MGDSMAARVSQGDEFSKIMPGFGLRFLGFKRSTGIPNFVAWSVTSCHPREGRRDRTVGIDDPDRVSKANAGWYALATELKLFSAERLFLVSLDLSIDLAADRGSVDEDPAEMVWGLVELLDEWDIMGAGAASRILGWGFGCPGFAMSAVDGSVFVQGTVWQDSIGSSALPCPSQVPSLREMVRKNLGKPYRTAAENEDALSWLARTDC
ncbi:hypothetical protein [Micromonospora okii]|uniref:hypothetical protein n=1 Tax=Micromonospora okii TaxID=1182970 RepID=UPI001E315B75|nr:hypothetical protein [Micromonospora okii]